MKNIDWNQNQVQDNAEHRPAEKNPASDFAPSDPEAGSEDRLGPESEEA
jgi:hypothetical protein